MKFQAIATLLRLRQPGLKGLHKLPISSTQDTRRIYIVTPTQTHQAAAAAAAFAGPIHRLPYSTTSVATPAAHNSSAHRHSSSKPSFTTSTTSAIKMASDEDYMSFLDKANKDLSDGMARQQSQPRQEKAFKATDAGVEVPEPVAKLVGGGDKVFYTSDADEPFEAVALRWDEDGKGLPDEYEFARLIEHPASDVAADAEAAIEIMDPIDWDRRGAYKEVIDAVRRAGEGNDVRVYRVARDKGGVKVEYWVVTTEGKGKGAKLVGVKALAVES